jgi:hypothetical protein
VLSPTLLALYEWDCPGAASHWTIYLIHDGNRSTRLSMGIDQRPEIEYPRGRVTVSTYEFAEISNSAVRFWEFPAAPNITVKDVLDVIINLRRNLYDMGDNGRGCRYWV